MVDERLKLERELERAREKRQAAQQALHEIVEILQFVKRQYEGAQERLLLADREFDQAAEHLRLLGPVEPETSTVPLVVEAEVIEAEIVAAGDEGSDGGPTAEMVPLDEMDKGGDEDGEE